MLFPKVRLAGWMMAFAVAALPACQNEIPNGSASEPPVVVTANAGSGQVGLAAATSPSPNGPTPTGGADQGGDPVGSLSGDQQIAGVDLELHSRAMVMAVVADARADRGDVRLFAIHMVTDASAASRRVAAIVQGAGTPEDSALRRQLGSETGQVANGLWVEPRATFARYYVDTQVAIHAAAVPMLTSLMARTQDAVLQAELRDQIDAWQKQLDDARALQTSISAAGDGAGPPISQAPAPGAPP